MMKLSVSKLSVHLCLVMMAGFTGAAVAESGDGGSASCNVNIGSRSYRPSLVYPSGHYCLSCRGQDESHCQNLNRLVVVDRNPFGDTVTTDKRLIIPRNGVWGGRVLHMDESLPGEEADLVHPWTEASSQAIDEAVRNDFHVIELGVVLVPAGHPPGQDFGLDADMLFVGSYLDMKAYGGTAGEAPDHSILNYTMRNRDQSRHRNAGSWSQRMLLPFSDAFIYGNDARYVIRRAMADNLIVIADPIVDSIDTPAGKNTYFRTLAAVIYRMHRANALSHLIVRTRFSYTETTNGVYDALQSLGGVHRDEVENKFLWAVDASNFPQPDTRGKLDSILSFIDDWKSNTSLSKAVAMYEVPLSSPGLFSTSHFTVSSESGNVVVYFDIANYVQRLSNVPRRAALRTYDPKNPRGGLNTSYDSEFPGVPVGSANGNPIFNLSLNPHLAFITERPLFYKGILTQMHTTGGGESSAGKGSGDAGRSDGKGIR